MLQNRVLELPKGKILEIKHGARHQQDARRRYGHKAKMTKMTDMTEMTEMTEMTQVTCAMLNALQIKDERKAFRVGDITR